MRRGREDFGNGEPVIGLPDVENARSAVPGQRRRGAPWLLGGAALLLGLMLYDARQSAIPDEAETGFVAPAVPAPPLVSSARAPATGLATERQASDCGGSPAALPITPPQPIGNIGTWVSPDDYPAVSLRANEEGVSAMRLGVDSSGRIATCEIVGPSGHPALDAAACGALQARGRYRPAHDARDCPMPYRLPQRVRWTIPRE